MSDDLTLPAKVRLLNLLNEENAQQGAVVLTTDNVIFGEPDVTTLNNRNTVCVLTARPTSGFKGQKTVYYNRLNLTSYFSALFEEVVLHVNNPQNVYDLLPAILEEYGVYLDETDIVAGSVNGTEAVLTAKSTSYGWTGNIHVTIDIQVTPLSQVITNLLLDGFVSSGLPEYALADITVPGKDQLLTLINSNNNQEYTYDDISLGLPQAIPLNEQVNGYNTTVVVTAENPLLSGDVTVTYKRAEGSARYPTPFVVTADVSSVNDTNTLIPILNESLGFALLITDVSSISISEDDVATIVVFGDDNYVWKPGSVIDIDLPDVSLGNVIDALMPGFVYDGESPTYAEADPTIGSIEQLRTLINVHNDEAFTTNDYTLSSLDDITGDVSGKNTAILATAGINSEYTGNVIIKYNRLNIGQFYLAGLNLPNRNYIRNTDDLYQALAVIYGLAMRSDEIVTEVIADEATSHVLKISGNSETWLPLSGITITFEAIPAVPNDAFLLDSGSPFMFDSGSIMVLDAG